MTQRIFTGQGFLGIAVAAPLAWALMAGAASAQQAYYYPQAGNGPVTINYGAITPYAAPGYTVPGYAPLGYPQPTLTGQPKSVFTPQAVAPVYAAPVYAAPNYSPGSGAPSSQFLPGQAVPQGLPYNNQGSIIQGPVALAGPGYGGRAYSPITYTASPIQAPFVAPYANPALMGQTYANGQVALMGTPQPGAKPFDPNSLKRKSSAKKAAASAPAPSAPSAVEAAAAAQVAAVEEQLESGQMAAAPSEPLAAPTPPEAPAEIPASVPSPVQEAAMAPAAPAPTAAIADAAAPAEPATDAGTETATESASIEPDAEAAPGIEEATAEETPAETGGAAALPAGGTRIVFEGTADDLPATATSALDAIAQNMTSDESLKVQVLAYSSSVGDNESQARRKALARGLEVRKYLIGKGVRSNRIDVRALGSKSEGSPADRVDIVPAAS